MLEEWKKLWKKKIYFLTLNYFLLPKLLPFFQHFQSFYQVFWIFCQASSILPKIFGKWKKIYFLTLNYLLLPNLLPFFQHFQSFAGLLNSLLSFFHSSKKFWKMKENVFFNFKSFSFSTASSILPTVFARSSEFFA